MAFTAEHVKVVQFGTLNNSQTWSVGFAFGLTGGPMSQADCNGLANAHVLAFAANVFFSTAPGILSKMANYVVWQGARAYYYPPGSTHASAVGSALSAGVSATGSANAIPQAACVVTLQTALAGRGNRGRVYLPAISPSSLTAGRMNSTDTDSVANSIKSYLDAANTITVGSQTFHAIVAGGLGAAITQVRVDNVIDTQRRRRDKFPATYSKTVAL